MKTMRLAGRPRHEAICGHIIELLRSVFGASYDDIAHEVYRPGNTGRIDALWGATVRELKTDLRREIGDVLRRMLDYLADATARARGSTSVTGLATDGATFSAYALSGGALKELARYETDTNRLEKFMGWLEPLLSDRPDLLPEPRAVAQASGRGSLAFAQGLLAAHVRRFTVRA